MADRLSFKIFLTSLFVLLTTGLTHAQNPTDSVLLERVLDYRSNFQQQNDGQQQNAYMKYTFRTERRNVMLNLVPTMYTLAKGERLRVGESYCRLTCSNPQHIDFRRQVSAGNIAHYKKAMPTVLELVIPFIYEECLFDRHILSPFYRGNKRLYRYTTANATDGMAVITFTPRLTNTQLISGKAYVETATGRITEVMFEGEYDMIDFKVDVIQSDEVNRTQLPRSCHVDADFHFVGNKVHAQYDAVFGCATTLPDSIEDKTDHLLMERLRPIALRDEERQLYENYYAPEPDSIANDTTEHSREWWRDVGNALSDNLFSSIGTESDNAYFKLSPIINPQYISYSHRRGLSYKMRIGARYNFSPRRYLTLNPELGYNFKFRQFYFTAPLRMTYNPKRNGYAEIVVQNGNRITNSSVLDIIEKENMDIADLDNMALDYFRDTHIEVSNNIEAFDWLTLKTALSYHRRKAINSAKMIEMGKPDVYRSFAPVLTFQFLPWHDGPLFTLDYERGIANVLKSDLRYERWEMDAVWKIPLRRMSLLNLRAGSGFYTNKHTSYFVDFENFRDNNIPGGWNDDWTGQFQLLDSKWYNASNYYIRANASFESPLLFATWLPLVGRYIESERLYAGVVFMEHTRPYYEIGYGLTNRYFSGGLFMSFLNGKMQEFGGKITLEIFRRW